ncbi:MAG: DNA recombination protein RmuC [Oscillospiraceae bacterium]|nr:DNA recombination protein RmuC [Oscillospiraceae bacterium]
MELTEWILLSLSLLNLVLLLVLLLRRNPAVSERALKAALRELSENNLSAVSSLGQALQNNQALSAQMQDARLDSLEEKLAAQMEAQHVLLETLQRSVNAQLEQFRSYSNRQIEQLEKTLSTDSQQLRTELTERMGELLSTLRALQQSNEDKLEQMRSAMSEGMRQLREENGRKLDEIRGTVDEKLQSTLEKRISESFRTVSEQLEQVYKGIGEMQSLAGDVGGLKKVLSGVKTRGILGEVQLGAILEEILSPEQYETNVATIPGSSERVEYAIRLPGRDGGTVYLPIDSKFPGDRYAQLRDAQEEGDREKIEAAYRNLEQVIRSEAKDIRTKYVELPYTTNFGVMFLPFEGLYAEVVNRGLIEKLQQDYRISVAGPSTMAALLNSLQMGFRTLAIQKRSGEVWEVLGAVKTEFEKFGDTMRKMQTHLSQTTSDLDALIGTRSRAIERRLRSVQKLDDEDARKLLEDI